ncbi:MAG: tetratricopeptide repeat protein [Bacteroidota bacterium]
MQNRNYTHKTSFLFSVAFILLFVNSFYAQSQSDSIVVKTLIDSAANAKSPQLRIKLAQEAYQIALRSNKKYLLANATHAMGNALFRLNSYDAAIDSLQKALVLFNLINDSAGVAKTYYTLGACYIRKSNYIKAIQLIEESVKMATRLNDSALLANSFNSLGIVYYTLENYNLSADFFEKAARYYEKVHSFKNYIRVKGNIGLCLVKTGEKDRAKKTLFSTLNDYGKYMDSLMLASFYDNIGVLYEGLGRIDSALHFHNHSLNLSKKLKSSRGIALSSLAIGRCHNIQGKYGVAKKYLLEAKQLSQKNGEEDITAQTNRQLAICYEELGDFRNSQRCLKEFLEYNDKTFTKQFVSQIAQLHSMLQLEKQEKENQQLQLQLELKSLNEQKDEKIIRLYTIFSILLLITLSVIVYFAIQLSHRKKLLEHTNSQLFKFNNELDSLVKHRTQELNIAIDRIRELERIKSAFLANISHEIRTPLNGILGLTYYLSNPEVTNEERIQLGEQVKKLGNKLIRIVDDILELSKIETNQVNLLLSEVNLNQLLDDVYNEFRSNDDFKKDLFFKVNKSLPDDKSIIICDYNRLRSIIVNLLENAFKFTHQGGVEVGYSINENSMLHLYVKDTGMGIPYDIQKKVFERFYKHMDEANPIFYDGLGIGLTIAMGYAIALGGSIKLQSTPGYGSTFTLVIPITIPNPNNKKEMVNFSGKRILVVEDDLISYQYLHALLSKTGATVIHVKNAEDAIEATIIDRTINLILLDIQLPFKSGIEAAIEIRKMNQEVPIIAQTATDGENAKACREAGCNAFITKPVDPDELLNLIKRFI